MFRYMRLTTSVFCILACIVVVALWVRSYWWADWTALTNTFGVASIRGVFIVDVGSGRYTGGNMNRRFETKPIEHAGIDESIRRRMGFAYRSDGKDWAVKFPHWFIAVTFAAVASIQWISWRFFRSR